MNLPIKYEDRSKIYPIKNVLPGKLVTAYGKISYNKIGYLEIINPEYHIHINNKNTIINSLTPIYSTINGVSQTTLRSIITNVFKLLYINPVSELIQKKLTYNNISMIDALRVLHKPPKSISINDLKYYRHPAQRRIIFEELLAYSISLLNFIYKIKKNIKHYHCELIQL